jgi:glucose/arabinose dehydrogenase
LALATCGGVEGPTPKADAAPAEVRTSIVDEPPNAEGQSPAFPAQTRAPRPAEDVAVSSRVLASGLEHPWAIEVLADGRMLVTERPGRLRVVTVDGRVLDPIAGVPAVVARGQGGLLDVAVRPTGTNQWALCLSYADPRDGGRNATAVSCGQASGAENITLSNMRVVFRQEPAIDSRQHFGSRIVFQDDDTVFITLGDRGNNPATRPLAQDMSTTVGKIVRVNLDGTVPADNPFAARGGPTAQIWSVGHRNIQSAALDATGELWAVEHGARGGDELNRPEAGKNYGWPVISYGIDYSGAPITEGVTAREGLEQPVYYWDPVIAPSGMAFYTGDLFPAWRGHALIGGLKVQSLVVLGMDDGRVVTENRVPLDVRVRDVAQGPDGRVFVVSDSSDGAVIELTPAG